jgi:hypothetical protein
MRATGGIVMTRLPRLICTFMAVLILTISAGASHADAARGWCLADPVIIVDGQLADVFVSSDPAMLLRASGPIEMVITIPTGSKGAVILTDLGFLRGYKISFRQSSSLKKTTSHTQVKVSVYAPNTGTRLPVKVTFAPRTLSSGLKAILFGQSASGYSNSWVTLKTG